MRTTPPAPDDRAMNESSALEVAAVRAVETTDRARMLWSDADRSWASRAAAEVVGEGASPSAFVARRARLALERLTGRYAALRRAVHGLRWRRWIGLAIIAGALVAGVVVDQIGAGRRVNVLAPPLLGVLAWNVAVYVVLLVAPLMRKRRRSAAAFAGPLRNTVVRIASGAHRAIHDGGKRPLEAALAALAREWTRVAAPLYTARAARILHFAAAAFAAGVIAGMYVRGLAFEYRATWESTFLDAPSVHRVLSILLAPGMAVTGLPLPTVDAIAAMRSGAGDASVNAASWLHLIAATVVVVVIAPRIVLGLLAWTVESHRARRLDVPVGDPYFQRVLRGFHGGPVRVKVVPYSYAVPPASLSGLQALVTRVFGGSAALVVSSPIAYGEEDSLPESALPDGSGPALALLNLSATPEREAHGAFVAAMRAAAGDHAVIVLIDEAPFVARNPDPARLEERRAAWRAMFGEIGAQPVFANLANPDLVAIEAELEAML
jgi:hypothetical protein